MVFPSFILSVGGPLFPWQTFDYNGQWHLEDGTMIPVDSCHLYGTKDPYRGDFRAHEVYREAVIIGYPDGHKFPARGVGESLEEVLYFLKK